MNEDEASFSVDSMFSFFVNVLALLLCFDLLNTLLQLLFKRLLFFGRRRETVCLTGSQGFSFLCVTIKGNICGLQPVGGRFKQIQADLTSPLDTLNKS